jgi:hypothetical protein
MLIAMAPVMLGVSLTTLMTAPWQLSRSGQVRSEGL